ncbi:hypothetical protein JW613_26035 [Streptomyces smyrnaeus]|uniref:Lipoprotein n=1 Tax=Streptomyces smyrnaeus TaxID=1387713 RepID=A0ABS3Y2B3_9ACTN|nr:hypothetical protein [Streptomyces smyrnaeus]MBO8201730.1 hypothetical protein [Streptomyces smyrnaeus]
MFITRKRSLIRTLPAAALLLAGALLTGCGGDSSDGGGEQDPAQEAAGDDGARSGAGKQFDKALEYAQCMRDNGVKDFPDPKQEGGGVRIGGSGVDRGSAAFKEAEQACRDKAPQMDGGKGKPLDSKKVAAWAACMRENGLDNFPDPAVNGSVMQLDMAGTGIEPGSKAFQDAQKACRDKYPGGGIQMKGGGAR